MARYKVWNPDEEGEDDAQEIEAPSPDDAAEVYLSALGPHFNTYDMCVKDVNGILYDVSIDVEVSDEGGVGFQSYSRKVHS